MSIKETGLTASKGSPAAAVQELHDVIMASLEDSKAEDIVDINLKGKTSIADHMIVATGRSSRQVASIADHVFHKVKDLGRGVPAIEGLPQADWVLVDAGDVIIHIFRPEVRDFYNLEKMWSMILDGENT